MSLSTVHRDPTGQVDLYQTDDRYFQFLAARFGQRFLDYRHRWGITSQRGAPGDFPLSLDLAINSGCQLSCLMCPLPSRPEGHKVRLMDPVLFEHLMHQAERFGLAALTLGLGSEPLLSPVVAEWVGRAVGAGIMDIRLGTNGLLLTQKVAQALVESGLTRLEISVDSVNPETYRAIRGGSLDELERAIDIFLEARQKAGLVAPLLRLSFLQLASNQGELADFLAKWRGRADLIAVQKVIWFPGSRLPRPHEPGQPMAPLCAQPWQRLAVNWDGRIWPCCSWSGENLVPFKASEDDLAGVWRSKEMAALRLGLAGGPGGHPPECRKCEC